MWLSNIRCSGQMLPKSKQNMIHRNETRTWRNPRDRSISFRKLRESLGRPQILELTFGEVEDTWSGKTLLIPVEGEFQPRVLRKTTSANESLSYIRSPSSDYETKTLLCTFVASKIQQNGHIVHNISFLNIYEIPKWIQVYQQHYFSNSCSYVSMSLMNS